MDVFGSGHRPYGGNRRLEIVSGKSYGCNQNYTGRARSPDLPAFPGDATLASHSGAASVPKPWSFNDPESKRKKRIAKYKVYTVEGKVKATLRKGLRWIKNKCSQIVHGY
ncbi:hypothetical protein L6164_034748 [Bauhinia variegata]|uniref:Uncharacterized protein n=1 Tax=Bauhinia variegata TaxID=167791 RepID=A0ACB9KW22_BAUVA|nr:hypothetical protein L6164_034748 [Bauhinia variegata]